MDRERRMTPLYRQPPSYAQEHGELEQYRSSLQANIACKNAIEKAIRENFDGMHLQTEGAKAVMAWYGPERTAFVLANTVQLKSWDGRFSRANQEWAAAMTMPDTEERRCAYCVESHPAVLDGFVAQVRRELAAREQPGLPRDKPSIRAQLAARPPQTTRPAPGAMEKGER